MEPPDDSLIMFGEISELKGKNSSPDCCSGTVEPRLSRLVGTSVNSPDDLESG